MKAQVLFTCGGAYVPQVTQAQTKQIKTMCETKILTHKNATVISHCPECSMLNIWHQNLMLCSTPEQFGSFQNFTRDLDFDDRSFPFPDGSERLVLCTPNRDINFVFTEEEWADFNTAMLEAGYLLEAYNTIYQSR